MNILNNQLPIGVFDSGVGGLTVLRALHQVLPNESFLYLGDTARLPYGTKSPDTVIRYATQASKILIQQKIKLLVIACNTASALALASLQETFPEIPIIGVLEPSAKAACLASQKGHIAVIATEATVKAGGYQAAIRKNRPEAQIVAESCGLFVSLAEEGWVDGPITQAIAKQYLDPLLKEKDNFQPDCLVLGCTHFPVLLSTIQKVVASGITIVDSAATTAQIVLETLQRLSLQNINSLPTMRFLVTDAPERFARTAIHFLGLPIALENVSLVDILP